MSAPAEEPTEDVEEIVVTSATGTPVRLSDSVVAAEVIDRDAIEASGALTLDQLLETIPGLQLLDGLRGPGLSLRGHAPEHTLVLVDGRRAIGRVGGSVDLRRFPVDRIERIEIVRGPTSAVHGADALGGVVQIITRDDVDAWHADVGLTAGGYVGGPALDDRAVVRQATGAAAALDQLALDADVGFSIGAVRARAGLSAQGVDGWDRAPDDPGTTGDAQRRLAPSAGLTWTGGGDTVRVLLDGLVVEGRGVDAAATGAVSDRLHLSESWDATLAGRFTLPREVMLDARLDVSTWRDQLRTDQRLSDALDGYEETREVLARPAVIAEGWADRARRHHLQGGVEGLFERVRADRLEVPTVSRQRGAVHVQHTWRALDAPGLVVLTGARLELDSQFGVFPAPRIAVRLDPHRAVRLRVAGGLGFRAPDFKQLYLSFANPGVGYRVSGNEALRPERSLGGTVDLELHPHRVVDLTLSGWHDRVTDLIVTDAAGGGPGQAEFTYVNVGRARIQGLSATLELGRGAIVGGALGYTLTDADDLDADRPLPGRAEHQGTARLTVSEPRTRLSGQVGATVLGPRAFYPGADGDPAVITDVLPLLDARIAWRGAPALELFLGVDNALDAGRSAFDATHPRRVYGGVRASLTPRTRRGGADT